MKKMGESNGYYLHNDYGYNTTDYQKQEHHYAFIGSYLSSYLFHQLWSFLDRELNCV